MNIPYRKHLLFSVFCFCTIAVQASDLAKEQRWQEQIVDALFDGEAVTLNDGSNDFLAIYTEAEDPKPTSIIVLHGIGIHPDWDQVIKPLRVGLAEEGWTTLSLQLPVLPNEAEYKDYIPLMPEAAQRIAAGVKYLHTAGSKNIIVISHSLGSHMAAYALAKNAVRVQGFITIGTPESALPLLSKINTPTLDLYGSEDLPAIVQTADDRARIMKGKNYKQVMVPDADHFFADQDDKLLEQVTSWLNQL